MKGLLITTTVLSMAFTGAAFAQSSSSSNPQSSPQPNAPSGNQLVTAQKLAQDLQKSGFSDVKVVAESFVIQAKTKDGDPVFMTVGPHGMTAFEAFSPDNAKTTGSTGSGKSNLSTQSNSSGSTTQK
jgi:hypothetical protein